MTPTKAQSDEPIKLLLIAIGGYGGQYVAALKEPLEKGEVRISGVVDPLADKSPEWPALKEAGVPLFDTIDEFLKSDGQVELAIISSPIALHADHTCAALEAGMNVLCEKPLTAQIDDAYRMIEARDRSGKFLEIGYQWSFSQPIQSLKSDILDGHFGRPRRFSTWAAWPRGSDYYGRNRWAGRIRDDAGRWVFDSPANNATAHYLHNMLYLLGPAIDRAAMSTAITGECYRANPVENFDAVCCRVETENNTDILFYTAHCVQENKGPFSRFEFENGVVDIQEDGEVVAHFTDGREKRYGNPEQQRMRKLKHCLQRCRAVDGGRTLCGPEAALAQTRCIHGLQQMPVTTLNNTVVAQKTNGQGTTQTYVPGLEDIMRRCCEQGTLFSELHDMNVPWADHPTKIELNRRGELA